MFTNPFIGPQVRSLIHELTLISGKQFRNECFLSPEEELGPNKRISLATLVHGKVSVVRSLHELTTVFHEVEQFLLYNYQVTPGYEKVAEKYHELLMQRWIIAADKYKKGYDPTPNPDFRTWAFGLIEIDQILLDELRSVLQDAEKSIREAPLPDFVPPFRIDYLTNDLIETGIPISGLNVQKNPTPENDATPCGYFKLENGRYVRCTMPENTTLTDEQRRITHNIILEHEKVMEKQGKVCEVVRLGLIRDGHKISSLRFNRSALELTFDPEKFVSIDTEMGILEIRTHQPLGADQRKQIKNTVKERLNSCGVKTLMAINDIGELLLGEPSSISNEQPQQVVNIYGGQSVVSSGVVSIQGGVMGDTFNMSGDFRNTILNMKSTLEDVRQSISTIPNPDTSLKDELRKLVNQLEVELQKVPTERSEEAEAVAEIAKVLVEAVNKEKPNKVTVQVSAEGLKQAAKNLAGVVPIVLTIATQIVDTILKFAG